MLSVCKLIRLGQSPVVPIVMTGHNFTTESSTVHHSQVASLTDSLIEVDSRDNVLGSIPKLEGHLAKALNDGRTHRAFSVFLLSNENRSLLVQKRAKTKIVFPREWANTCCSHPLYTPEEMNNENGANMGIKSAASKRLNAELGINATRPDSFKFKGKILYRKMSPGGIFGESEVDYILFNEMSEADPSLVNPCGDEVESYEWVRPGPSGDRTKALRDFLEEETKLGFPPTPWFDLMVKTADCLPIWWEQAISDPLFFRDDKDTLGGEVRNFLEN